MLRLVYTDYNYAYAVINYCIDRKVSVKSLTPGSGVFLDELMVS